MHRLIAIRQDDLKRLVAYSSIAHIGLMCCNNVYQKCSWYAGCDVSNVQSWYQYYWLWIVVDVIEQQFRNKKDSGAGRTCAKSSGTCNLVCGYVLLQILHCHLPMHLLVNS